MKQILASALAVFFVFGCSLPSCTPTHSVIVVAPQDVTPPQRDVIGEQIEESSGKTNIVPILKDYNVVVWRGEHPGCGGTVVRSTAEMTLVLTALHCMALDEAEVAPYGYIQFNDDDKYRVVVVRISRQQDLALLLVTDPIGPKLAAPLAETMPTDGEPLWIVGFGAGQEDIVSHGTVALMDTKSAHTPETHCMLVDGSAFYGNSGGGVFNAEGELVGVLIQIGPSHPAQGLWSYATHWAEVKKVAGPFM